MAEGLGVIILIIIVLGLGIVVGNLAIKFDKKELDKKDQITDVSEVLLQHIRLYLTHQEIMRNL